MVSTRQQRILVGTINEWPNRLCSTHQIILPRVQLFNYVHYIICRHAFYINVLCLDKEVRTQAAVVVGRFLG
jgi:hypothetical protein